MLDCKRSVWTCTGGAVREMGMPVSASRRQQNRELENRAPRMAREPLLLRHEKLARIPLRTEAGRNSMDCPRQHFQKRSEVEL